MEKQPNQQKRQPKNDIKFTIQLSEEQKKAKTEILQHPFNFVEGKVGSGKAQPLNSLVLTPSGYIEMGQLQVGDVVCTPSGTNAKILAIYPQGKKDIYTITFNDGSKAECCAEHLWTVQYRTHRYGKHRRKGYANRTYQKWQTLSLQEILANGLQDKRAQDKWFIPVTSPILFDVPNIEYKIDPYILGCLLGDGHFGKDQVMLSTSDAEIKEYFNQFCQQVDMVCNYTNHGYDYRLVKSVRNNSKSYLQEALQRVNLTNTRSTTKFIPKVYLLQSVEDRLSLLQGLLDTDGGIEGSSVVFNSTSKQLTKDIQFLVQSLGGVVRVSSRPSKLNGKETGTTTYRSTIVLPEQFLSRAFRLSRKQSKLNSIKNKKGPVRTIRSIELTSTQEAQCIYIDSNDHLYLTDNMLVTHNTLVACQVALDLFFKREINKIVITRPTVGTEDNGFLPGTFEEKMEPWMVPIKDNMRKVYNYPEKLEKHFKDGDIELVSLSHFRGRTFENAVCIVDEFQNLTKQQLSMALGRLGKNSIMIFCGDSKQIDLKYQNDSAIHEVAKLESSKYVYRVKLTENHRHQAVDEVLNLLYNYH